MGQLTPEMWDAVRKLMEAGGYEGMKQRIVEEGESLAFLRLTRASGLHSWVSNW